ncbi:hypothetical protein JTE90_008675 [Oedothorax gibbosus]|uniref:Uncharacterized protein n=1 Tax=Oedothorax gibbosus TaxID=931172 RepID=A0AAV6U1P8_9ARAC|nr:hypothetical protein JTE90_008675 [Oedothorax gibbosus]
MRMTSPVNNELMGSEIYKYLSSTFLSIGHQILPIQDMVRRSKISSSLTLTTSGFESMDSEQEQNSQQRTINHITNFNVKDHDSDASSVVNCIDEYISNNITPPEPLILKRNTILDELAAKPLEIKATLHDIHMHEQIIQCMVDINSVHIPSITDRYEIDKANIPSCDDFFDEKYLDHFDSAKHEGFINRCTIKRLCSAPDGQSILNFDDHNITDNLIFYYGIHDTETARLAPHVFSMESLLITILMLEKIIKNIFTQDNCSNAVMSVHQELHTHGDSLLSANALRLSRISFEVLCFRKARNLAAAARLYQDVMQQLDGKIDYHFIGSHSSVHKWLAVGDKPGVLVSNRYVIALPPKFDRFNFIQAIQKEKGAKIRCNVSDGHLVDKIFLYLSFLEPSQFLEI